MIDQQLDEIVKNQNPAAAFAQLRRLMADDNVASRCHLLAHTIGESAFIKYKNFKEAIKFNDDICGSGYVHGLAINVLNASANPTDTIHSLCDGMDGFCYHGIGHGLMFYTKNNVPDSANYCLTLDTNEHQTRCSEGVFMQNFESSELQMYATPYFFPNDPLKICRTETHFKPACYLYAGAYLAKQNLKTNTDLFSACNFSESGYINQCVSGMGSYIMATNLNNPKKAESICEQIDNQAVKSACIDGLVSYHLVNYNSIEKTETFCASLEAANQPACNTSLLKRKQYYQK
ncbi:MAG TPA: hypothetical protein VLK22_00075 [Candidatus Udaeobacter sp.]|nr:hypothetical protein [Candidatus Udaeobacter sp.]